MPEFDRINFVADKVSRRLEILAQAGSKLPANCQLTQLPALEDISSNHDGCDWRYFANHGAGILAVAHLTTLPMTRYHDEFMFVRSANIAECCFRAIACAVESAAGALERESPAEIVQCLNSAAELASFMTLIFVTFDTLPYESFYDGFRPATGNASTIQSTNYQRMDLLTRGFNERKQHALPKHCEVADFAAEDADARPTLRWLSKAVEKHPADGAISKAIDDLRQNLFQWRARHLGIARRFLPKGVAGTGNEGFSYLVETFRTP